jgi:hypothetical protein
LQLQPASHRHWSPHSQEGAQAQVLPEFWQPQVQSAPTQFTHWQEEGSRSFMAISWGLFETG